MPSFSSGLPRVTPFASAGTRNAVMPLCARERSVIANSRTASACGPFVMKFFAPLMTYSSPRVTAVVRISPASEPLMGSVSAKQPSRSPRANGARNSVFCSSVPYLRIGSQ